MFYITAIFLPARPLQFSPSAVLGRSPSPCGAAELLHAAHAEFGHHTVTWRSVGDRGDGEKTWENL